MDEYQLSHLAEPFPPEDVEWRVSRSGISHGNTYCHALAYITARAIQQRLDDVCGAENWKNEPLTVIEVRPGKVAMQVGISIRAEGEWVTKWDVSEPTNIEPAKGGFSGAMKRAGAQWGIGRYLYHLPETRVETSDKSSGTGWNWARLPEKHGGDPYFWKTPQLPSWALPKEPEHAISESELTELKLAWRAVFAPDSQSPSELRNGFATFVRGVAGEFPVSDRTCWTRESWDKCRLRIENTTEPTGPDSDIPFN